MMYSDEITGILANQQMQMYQSEAYAQQLTARYGPHPTNTGGYWGNAATSFDQSGSFVYGSPTGLASAKHDHAANIVSGTAKGIVRGLGATATAMTFAAGLVPGVPAMLDPFGWTQAFKAAGPAARGALARGGFEGWKHAFRHIGRGGTRAMLGGIGAGVAGMVPIIGAYALAGKAVTSYIKAGMEGIEEQFAVNQLMLNYAHGGNLNNMLGHKWTADDTSAMYRTIHDISRQSHLTNVGDISNVLGQGLQSGMFKGVRSTGELQTALRDLTTALRDTARTFSTSMEGAMPYIQAARDMGFRDFGDAATVARTAKQTANVAGMGVDKILGAGQMGMHMALQAGASAGQIRKSVQDSMGFAGRVGMMSRLGTISNDQLFEMTGQYDEAGREALAGQMTSIAQGLAHGRFGRMMSMALMNPDTGEYDSSLTGRLGNITGDRDTSMLGGARRSVRTRHGRVRWMMHRGRVMQQAMSDMGPDAFAGNVLNTMAREIELRTGGDEEVTDLLLERMTGVSQRQQHLLRAIAREAPKAKAEMAKQLIEDARRSEGEALYNEEANVQALMAKFKRATLDKLSTPVKLAWAATANSIRESVQHTIEDLAGVRKIGISSATSEAFSQLMDTGSSPVWNTLSANLGAGHHGFGSHLAGGVRTVPGTAAAAEGTPFGAAPYEGLNFRIFGAANLTSVGINAVLRTMPAGRLMAIAPARRKAPLGVGGKISARALSSVFGGVGLAVTAGLSIYDDGMTMNELSRSALRGGYTAMVEEALGQPLPSVHDYVRSGAEGAYIPSMKQGQTYAGVGAWSLFRPGAIGMNTKAITLPQQKEIDRLMSATDIERLHDIDKFKLGEAARAGISWYYGQADAGGVNLRDESQKRALITQVTGAMLKSGASDDEIKKVTDTLTKGGDENIGIALHAITKHADVKLFNDLVGLHNREISEKEISDDFKETMKEVFGHEQVARPVLETVSAHIKSMSGLPLLYKIFSKPSNDEFSNTYYAARDDDIADVYYQNKFAQQPDKWLDHVWGAPSYYHIRNQYGILPGDEKIITTHHTDFLDLMTKLQSTTSDATRRKLAVEFSQKHTLSDHGATWLVEAARTNTIRLRDGSTTSLTDAFTKPLRKYQSNQALAIVREASKNRYKILERWGDAQEGIRRFRETYGEAGSALVDRTKEMFDMFSDNSLWGVGALTQTAEDYKDARQNVMSEYYQMTPEQRASFRAATGDLPELSQRMESQEVIRSTLLDKKGRSRQTIDAADAYYGAMTGYTGFGADLRNVQQEVYAKHKIRPGRQATEAANREILERMQRVTQAAAENSAALEKAVNLSTKRGTLSDADIQDASIKASMGSLIATPEKTSVSKGGLQKSLQLFAEGLDALGTRMKEMGEVPGK